MQLAYGTMPFHPSRSSLFNPKAGIIPKTKREVILRVREKEQKMRPANTELRPGKEAKIRSLD